MLQFPEQYFEKEIRDDFAISELMKRAWAAQMEVLQKIIEICEKYQLTYYAYWGSLLGAIRHQGFIPWDDDLDIAMKRDDYIRFLEVAQDELPEGYRVMNPYTEELYDNAFTRVVNGDVINLSEEKLREYHGCPFVVGIDVFPLYYIPRNSKEAAEQKEILKLIGIIATMHDYKMEEMATGNQTLVQHYDLQIAEGLVALQNATGYQFTAEQPLKRQLQILYDQVGRLFEEGESDCLAILPNYIEHNYLVEKELLSERLQVPFENMMINIPKGYDTILRKTYRDYLVPRKVTSTHDYPVYKEQLRALGEYIEKVDLECKALRYNIPEIPKEWMDKMYRSAETGDWERKKIVLYYTGASALLANSASAIEKLRHVFEIFKNQSDIVLWWFPCLLDTPELPFLKQIAPCLVREYQKLLEEYCLQDWGICDVSGDMQRAVRECNAFYGDQGELAKMCQATGKWVMLQDYEIVN